MKRLLFIGFLLLQIFGACTNRSDANTETAENDVDAARNFIRAALDNDFEKARMYVISDSINNQYLDLAKQSRANLSKGENVKYKNASIRIYDTRKLTDSVSIIIYANSFKNKKDSLKVVRENNKWLIDLKYSFMPALDTTHHGQ
ncbi:MAG: hypothetical protein C4329_08710 [Chitinophagaceae bacterium]